MAIPLYQIKIHVTDKSIPDKEFISDILRLMNLQDSKTGALSVFHSNYVSPSKNNRIRSGIQASADGFNCKSTTTFV